MIYTNISLKKYNTFGLDYKADCLIHVRSEKDALKLFRADISIKKPILILGGGSNFLFTDDFHGTILHPAMDGITIEKTYSDSVVISSGAGVKWDDLVEWTVRAGFCGFENLSLIPGTVGATPVQNIGAYGVEVKDFIESANAISLDDYSQRIFNKNEFEFGYRDSVFKNRYKNKYMITSVRFKLKTNSSPNLEYGTLKEEICRLGEATSENIRQAVINIRRKKLPDPEITGNAGSFFKNPVVPSIVAMRLKNSYPRMPLFDDNAGFNKLAAGWLIEQCGWKGKRSGDAGVHDQQALVLVNYGQASGKDIYNLSESIRESVMEKFGIRLDREVEVV